MARAINLILEVQDSGDGQRQYNLNDMGLVSFSFDRYLGNPKNIETGILSEFELSILDKSGYKIISILQKNRDKLRIKYGFNDNMSQIYVLNITKINAVFNNRGIMVTVGGIGSQVSPTYASALFKQGERIDDILRRIAKRNNWYVGDDNDNTYINCDIRLSQPLIKEQSESDYSFIVNKLKPIVNKSVAVIGDTNETVFWDVSLINKGAITEFYFRPSTHRGVTRRVWKYTYGVNSNSNIIEIDTKIDMSFLVNGLTVQIPVAPEEIALGDVDSVREKFENIINNKNRAVQNIINKYNLISLDPRDFKWNVELIASEDVGNMSLTDMVLKKLEDVMMAINTIKLTVIGNPDIMPTDLVELIVMNTDGNYNVLSSSATGGSYWKVISIKETIGLDGYKTYLGLVREVVNIT